MRTWLRAHYCKFAPIHHQSRMHGIYRLRYGSSTRPDFRRFRSSFSDYQFRSHSRYILPYKLQPFLGIPIHHPRIHAPLRRILHYKQLVHTARLDYATLQPYHHRNDTTQRNRELPAHNGRTNRIATRTARHESNQNPGMAISQQLLRTTKPILHISPRRIILRRQAEHHSKLSQHNRPPPSRNHSERANKHSNHARNQNAAIHHRPYNKRNIRKTTLRRPIIPMPHIPKTHRHIAITIPQQTTPVKKIKPL